jgi:hypothetical protein
MKSLEYDTGETSLRTVLKDYQEIALRTLWESQQGLNSRQVWEQVNKQLSPESISRASIINYLEAMRGMGVLKGVEVTGKGGHRWIYSPAMTESGFKLFVAETLISILIRDFPEETSAALQKVAG